jgi:predicted transcriptional regulator
MATMLATVERKAPIEIVDPFLDRAPVDLDAMARALGMEVRRDRTLPDDVSGKIERSGSGYRIALNGRHGVRRQRFTLAHEIAHYVLHRDLIGDGVTDSAMYRSAHLSDDVESQANRYAADLLMPAKLVRAAWREGVVSFADMAARFDVSMDAAAIRMRDLRLGG